MLKEILSESNLKKAYLELMKRNYSSGIDGVMLSQLKEYLILNWRDIESQLVLGTYEPNIVQVYELLSKKGKVREIYKFTIIDNFIQKAVSLILQDKLDCLLSDNNYSFRKGKGTIDVIRKGLELIEEGYEYIVEIDIKKYFENIDHVLLSKMLFDIIDDKVLISLIMKYQNCLIQKDGKIKRKNKGLITGSSISPVISNLYLMDLDRQYLEYNYIRYYDNIYIFINNKDDGLTLINDISKCLKDKYKLEINQNKTSITHYLSKRMLGYYFVKEDNIVKAKKNKQENRTKYNRWYKSAIKKENNEYHIINDGILTKKDYSILFENENKKIEIPAEVTEHINIYSQTIFSSNFFKTLNRHNIRVSLFDQYDHYIGSFMPINYHKSASILIKQVENYINKAKRLEIAKKIIDSGTTNIISNLKYYNKHNDDIQLDKIIDDLKICKQEMKAVKTLEILLLQEARMRELYYSSYNIILNNPEFKFTKRTRRPPKDALNAMISFGNTIIYQKIANEIYKTKLDIRISYLHSAMRRYENLNLDISEIIKPILVDKVIFSLINKRIIDAKVHFEKRNNGVFLNKEGKYLFIDQLNKKLSSTITINNKKVSYQEILQQEVLKLLRHFKYDEEYEPFKYRM
ncbi:type I-B CRISPR-associated endonuclease Cas1b [[Clostridium] saccharogumia]|uniref:type I-B CRISPR-associated endonuclease Cas1b n=1 Tax=Thomasclavelia saccharogumia TaxID=341225 RepID=UPI001D075A0C|nr:type I-B CRISPR-associated endonuclease Cas1b [Thomasclavelia saccharogumia]MCB6706559.1 type I-B CRISPR-associated endonuclease Cas1b [Thomasclavelia saccharogumia]